MAKVVAEQVRLDGISQALPVWECTIYKGLPQPTKQPFNLLPYAANQSPQLVGTGQSNQQQLSLSSQVVPKLPTLIAQVGQGYASIRGKAWSQDWLEIGLPGGSWLRWA